MIIKGKLVGFKTMKSKKGNDCFFGYLIQEDKNDPNLVGLKATSINAFGSDAALLSRKCFDKKLLDKEITCNGYFNDNQFFVVTLD